MTKTKSLVKFWPFPLHFPLFEAANGRCQRRRSLRELKFFFGALHDQMEWENAVSPLNFYILFYFNTHTPKYGLLWTAVCPEEVSQQFFRVINYEDKAPYLVFHGRR